MVSWKEPSQLCQRLPQSASDIVEEAIILDPGFFQVLEQRPGMGGRNVPTQLADVVGQLLSEAVPALLFFFEPGPRLDNADCGDREAHCLTRELQQLVRI